MSNKQKSIWWVLLALVGLASVLLARTHRVTVPPLSTAKSSSVSPNPTNPGDASSTNRKLTAYPSAKPEPKERGRVQMIRFTVFEQGLFPREIRVRAGLINLAIEDKTISSLGLVIERDAGRQRVGEVKHSKDSEHGKEVLRLTPGTYTVYDAGQRANSAKLVVEP